MKPRRSWLILGAILVLFGLGTIPYPGMISPFTVAIILVAVGLSIAIYELHR